MRIQRKSRLQPFPKQGETSHRATTRALLTKRGNEVGGGAGCGSGSWSGHSSPSHSAGATFKPFSQHPECNVHTGDEQPSMALSHSTEMEVDNLAAVPQRVSCEVVLDNPPSPNASAQPLSDPGAMHDHDVRVDVGDKKSKKKVEDKGKKPVFFMSVPLVDLDDYDISDNRLHCDNSSSDDNDAINLEGMDVGDTSVSSF